jgi:hypothetical protein
MKIGLRESERRLKSSAKGDEQVVCCAFVNSSSAAEDRPTGNSPRFPRRSKMPPLARECETMSSGGGLLAERTSGVSGS